MVIEFRRMDFNDISSLANYGQEILEEAKVQSYNDKTLIDVNMQDFELKELIDNIPASIDEEIDKNSDVSLNTLDKVLSFKLINSLIPNKFKNKINEEINTKKYNSENNSSTFLYNSVMTNLDNIRVKLEDEYTTLQEVVKTLGISKEQLITLIQKLHYVINEGEKSIEEYKNTTTDDNLKNQKIEVAERQIVSLKKSKVTLEGFAQAKDVSAMNIYMHAMSVRDWLQNNYVLLSHGVETAIESKYISNKVDLMNEINKTSNKVITDSSERLKIATQQNIQMLKEGSLSVNTINAYLKNVNEALGPIKGYIENKDQVTKKLIEDINKIQTNLQTNYQTIEEINISVVNPSIEEPKVLKIGQKTINND